MKKIAYALACVLTLCSLRISAVSTVYGQNKTQFPAQLEAVIHYVKKRPVIKPGLLGAVRTQETKNIPLTSFMTSLAQANTVSKMTIHKATLDTPTGPVMVPINYTFILKTATPVAEPRCGILTINADMTFTVIPDTDQCFFASF